MNKTILRAVGASIIPALLLGCTKLYKEDMSDCYDGVTVVLKVDPNTYQAQAAQAAAGDAVMYVFSSEGEFLERRVTRLNHEELLLYPDAGKLEVVGWLNEMSGPFVVTQFSDGTARGEGRVRLSTFDFNALPDLFYGDGYVQNEVTRLTDKHKAEHKEIFLSRRVGSMTVTVRGLREYTSKYDNNYSLVIGPTHSAIDFRGRYWDCQAEHTPPAAFNAGGELFAPIFNILPSGDQPLKVFIYHTELGLVYQTDSDSSGKPISVVADRTENVLIDLNVGISVSVQRTMWGVAHPWKTHL